MYSRNEPASSITALIQYLEQEHQSNYVYRGQTKDYGTMVPSVFRGQQLRKGANFLLLQENNLNSRLATVRATIIYVIVEKYGNVVGNYLAQQYCALSGCIDVTSKLEVAAFFATMSFPHYVGSIAGADEPGVIYRFNKDLFDHNIQPSGVKDDPFSISAKKGGYEVYTNKMLLENHFVKAYSADDLPDQVPGKYYTLESNITTFNDVKPFLDEIEEKNSLLKGIDLSQLPLLFKRAFAQYGGMIQPRYLCAGDTLEDPSPDHFNNMIGFEDIYSKYGMSAFYFRHNGAEPAYQRKDLWPGMWDDGTFATLCLILNKAKGRLGLEDDIRMQDIIDIGYHGNPHIQLDDKINLDGW
jgi:hypothetical protein